MTSMPAVTLVLLLLWSVLTSLDLVSFPQAMLSRPIVAATVAGGLLGDAAAGLRVGVVLELFALDVLPVGAVRYPDYGPAAVAAAAIAAGAPWELSLGLSVAVGLMLGVVGGWSLLAVRRVNARATQRANAALRSGDSGAIRALHYAGIGRDLLRSVALSIVALGLACVVAADVRIDRTTAVSLTLVSIGAGIASALGGAVRGAGTGARARWLAVGSAAGVGIAALVWGLG
jgi:mannose/fructose/N-acetylgalactosamine-specific phosphotransferase system component IIC